MLHYVFLIETCLKVGALRQHLPYRLHDVPPSAIVGRNGKGKTFVPRRERFTVADEFDYFRLELRQIADDFKSNAVLVQLADFLFQYTYEELHQEGDFIWRSTPIFAAERE